MQQIRVANYNLEAMPLINPEYKNCADTRIKNTLISLTGKCLKDKRTG